MTRTSVVLLLALVLTLQLGVVNAHTVNYTQGNGYVLQGYHYHGYNWGYVDWQPHTNLPTAWRDIFMEANRRWNNASSSPVYCHLWYYSNNLIRDADLGGPDARFDRTGDGGFAIRVDVTRCSSYSTERKTGVAVHELGHAIGLGDLTYSFDSDQVMYYSSGSRATYPYSNIGELRGDIYGARQIW